MPMLKTLSRLGAALKYAHNARTTERLSHNLAPEIRTDIGWDVMPTTKYLSSNKWGGL